MEAVRIAGTFFAAAALHGAKKGETEWLRDESPLPASFSQMALVLIVCSQISRYYKLQDQKPLSTPLTILGATTPILIACGAERTDFVAQKALKEVNRHLGAVLMLAYWVSICATFRLQKYKDVAAALSGYTFIVLVDRAPQGIRENTDQATTAYHRVNGLLFGESYFAKLLGLTKCFTYGEKEYSPLLFGDFSAQGVQPGGGVTKDQVKKYLRTAVDPTHLSARPKPWDLPSGGEMNIASRKLLERLETNKAYMNEDIYPEMRSILEKISPKLTTDTNKRLQALETASMAALTKELAKIYEELFRNELSAKDSLYFLLYRKQDEFLDEVFVDDYKGKPDWFRKLFGEGTPQQINIYRLFYGAPIGMNLDYANSDATQSPDANPFSRLIWRSYVESTSQKFFQEFYTEAEMIAWVKNNEFHTIPSVKKWFGSQGFHTVSTEAARFFLLQHGVLGVTALPR